MLRETRTTKIDPRDIHPIHEKCVGCDCIRVAKENGIEDVKAEYCQAYAKPELWWRKHPAVEGTDFFCPKATHLEQIEPKIFKKLNPIKASKRGGW